ncbi:MAG: sulfite exporter TauE/SafE family protein [Gammaproteobacteria bacterium]
MTPDDFAAFAAIGAVAGFFAGLLGIGGGAIMTPMLIIALEDVFPPENVAHAAIASSLAAISLTTLPSAWTHARNGAVDWRAAALLASGAVCGALLCARLAHHIPGMWLSVLLSLFLLRVSWRMFRPLPAAANAGGFSPPPFLPATGAAVGGVSSLLGIGGGVFYTPLLTGRGMPVKRAIGTSALINSPLAFSAAAGYVAGGLAENSLPAGSLGYVYLPATGGIAAFSMIFAFVGASLTAKLSDRVLRRIFGAMAAALALRLLLKTTAGI